MPPNCDIQLEFQACLVLAFATTWWVDERSLGVSPSKQIPSKINFIYFYFLALGSYKLGWTTKIHNEEVKEHIYCFNSFRISFFGLSYFWIRGMFSSVPKTPPVPCIKPPSANSREVRASHRSQAAIKESSLFLNIPVSSYFPYFSTFLSVLMSASSHTRCYNSFP